MISTMIMAAVLLMLPILLGGGFVNLSMKLGKEEKAQCEYNNNAFYTVTGLMLLMAAAELMLVVGIKQKMTVSQITQWSVILFGVLAAAGFALCVKRVGRMLENVRRTWEFGQYKFFLLIVVVLLFLMVYRYGQYNRMDTLRETVRTTLTTDTLFRYNPLTGMEMGNGMYPINQLMTRPLFDALLIGIAGQDVAVAMDYVLPGIVLLLHLMVMWLHAKDSAAPRRFMVLYGLALVFSLNRIGHYGFMILHMGHAGNTFVIGVILPYLFYLLKHWKMPMRWYCRVVLLGAVLLATIMNLNLTNIGDVLVFKTKSSLTMTLAVVVLGGIYLMQQDYFLSKKRIAEYLLAVLTFGLFGGYQFVIALVGDVLIERCEHKIRTGLAYAIGIIFAGGVYLFTQGDVTTGMRKANDEQAVVSGVIGLMEEKGLDTVKIAAPTTIVEIARREDGRLLLPYGRDYWISHVNEEIGDIYDDEAYALFVTMIDMENDALDEEGLWRITSLAADTGCDVLVTTTELPEGAIYTQMDKIDRYIIYSVLK